MPIANCLFSKIYSARTLRRYPVLTFFIRQVNCELVHLTMQRRGSSSFSHSSFSVCHHESIRKFASLDWPYRLRPFSVLRTRRSLRFVFLSEHERRRSEGESKDPDSASSAMLIQEVSTRMHALPHPRLVPHSPASQIGADERRSMSITQFTVPMWNGKKYFPGFSKRILSRYGN